MRHVLLFGSILSLGTLMVAACGANLTVTGDDDAGSSSGSSGTSGSSGSSGTSGTSGTSGSSGDAGDGGEDGGSKPLTLKTGETIFLGTTTDGYVAYIAIGASSASLEVVPTTGGAPTVLAPTFAATDGVLVSGAAVAFWQNVTTLKTPAAPPAGAQSEVGVGKLSYWTKATGTKANVEAASAVGLFYSSADSSRIAFSVGANITSSDFAVTSAATGSAAPVLTGNDALDTKKSNPTFDKDDVFKSDATCAPFIDFVGKVLMAAYCTGTGVSTTAARLYTVPDASSIPKRLDANGNLVGSIQPFWSASTAADKVFVIGSAASSTGRIIFNAATPTSATLDANTQLGLMLDDGSAVVYQTLTGTTTYALHRATAVATPVKTDLVTSGATTLKFLAPDQKHGIYSSIKPTNGASLLDLFSFTTGAASTPVTLVPTALAYAFGISPDSATLYYQTDVDQTGNGKLKSIPVAGGAAEKTLLPSIYDLRILKTATGSLVLTNPQTDSTTMQQTVDIGYFDLAAGGTPTPLATGVLEAGFETTGPTGKTLIYSTTGTAAGLFALALP